MIDSLGSIPLLALTWPSHPYGSWKIAERLPGEAEGETDLDLMPSPPLTESLA